MLLYIYIFLSFFKNKNYLNLSHLFFIFQVHGLFLETFLQKERVRLEYGVVDCLENGLIYIYVYIYMLFNKTLLKTFIDVDRKCLFSCFSISAFSESHPINSKVCEIIYTFNSALKFCALLVLLNASYTNIYANKLFLKHSTRIY